ncbi:MAG: hypothetical protein AAF657_15420 [Acidobacteriota bacterium]
MKKPAIAILALAALALTAPSLFADESQTLTGQFIWERSDKNIDGDLRAVFEPTGESAWNVSFYFKFEEKDHIYSGTAEGSLTDGTLKGKVMSDGDKPRPFEFEGTFADGSFQGTHTGFRKGEPSPTGTMTLSR